MAAPLPFGTPSHVSWPHMELHLRSQWRSPHGGAAPFWHTPHTFRGPSRARLFSPTSALKREAVFWKGRRPEPATLLGDGDLGERLAVAAPALGAFLQLEVPEAQADDVMVPRRNVALHTEEVPRPLAKASPQALRRAQRTPRAGAAEGNGQGPRRKRARPEMQGFAASAAVECRAQGFVDGIATGWRLAEVAVLRYPSSSACAGLEVATQGSGIWCERASGRDDVALELLGLGLKEAKQRARAPDRADAGAAAAQLSAGADSRSSERTVGPWRGIARRAPKKAEGTPSGTEVRPAPRRDDPTGLVLVDVPGAMMVMMIMRGTMTRMVVIRTRRKRMRRMRRRRTTTKRKAVTCDTFRFHFRRGHMDLSWFSCLR